MACFVLLWCSLMFKVEAILCNNTEILIDKTTFFNFTNMFRRSSVIFSVTANNNIYFLSHYPMLRSVFFLSVSICRCCRQFWTLWCLRIVKTRWAKYSLIKTLWVSFRASALRSRREPVVIQTYRRGMGGAQHSISEDPPQSLEIFMCCAA